MINIPSSITVSGVQLPGNVETITVILYLVSKKSVVLLLFGEPSESITQSTRSLYIM